MTSHWGRRKPSWKNWIGLILLGLGGAVLGGCAAAAIVYWWLL